MKKQDIIRCEVCGQFIGYQDLIDGKARHVMTVPDNHFGGEEYESLCRKHNKQGGINGILGSLD